MPNYKVLIYDMTGTGFGPGNLIAEFQDSENIGWAEYLNDVGEAFFTILQTDPKAALLRDHKNAAHLHIMRDSDLVWGGLMGEWDANQDDAVVYGYSYAALLYLVLTDWNVAYTNAQIDTIVDEQFTRAIGLTNSIAGWLVAGTIEAPVTTSGGATALVLPTYRMFYKRILHMLQELASLAVGETTNVVAFEVTPAGEFNFHKNLGSDLDDVWEYGGQQVGGFSEVSAPITRRNKLYGVGINPSDLTLRISAGQSGDQTATGLREDPIFFPWVRDSVELDRVVDARLARAVRDDIEVGLEFFPNSMTPPRVTGATWKPGDRVNVKVRRGLTNVDGQRLILGYQVVARRGEEFVRALIQERPGV